jgi:CubicO group peptidase (beta-lactamase class C family)
MVETITTRQLMQMRSGMQDYDDGAMFARTIAAPDQDLLPMDFLSAMNKTLLFPPNIPLTCCAKPLSKWSV